MISSYALRFAFVVAALVTGAAQAQDAAMKRIADHGVINLGYREASVPFSARGSAGPMGYSIELCKRAAQSVGAALGKDIKLNWVPVTAENRFEMVKSGKVDIECGVTTTTLARMKEFDFSATTFVDGGNILMPQASPMKGVLDAGGKKIGVIPGTTTEATLKRGFTANKVAAQLVAIKDHDEGAAALRAGRIDAYAADQTVLMGLVGVEGAKQFKLGAEFFSYEPYALMLPRNAPDLRLAVNRAISTLYRSPEIDTLYNQHFGAFGEISPLLRAMYLLNGTPD